MTQPDSHRERKQLFSISWRATGEPTRHKPEVSPNPKPFLMSGPHPGFVLREAVGMTSYKTRGSCWRVLVLNNSREGASPTNKK